MSRSEAGAKAGVGTSGDARNSKCLRIHKMVMAVPHGRVANYGQIADLAGLPGRARLVGRCMGQVPPGIKLPWHRILRASGEIAFPAGSAGAERQSGLLRGEGVQVNNNRVRMKDFQWRPGMDEILFRLGDL